MAKPLSTAIRILGVIGFAALGSGAPSALRAEPADGQAITQKGTADVAPCSICHGMDGEGKVGVGPRLAGQGQAYLQAQLSAFKSGARKSAVMQGVASDLDSAQAQDVTAYYASLSAPPHPDSAHRPAPENLAASGRTIAEQGLASAGVPACVACHGPGGIGSSPAIPYLAGVQADYMLRQLTAFKEDQRADPTGLMKPVAEKLSGDDAMAVTAYFASLPAPKRQGEK